LKSNQENTMGRFSDEFVESLQVQLGDARAATEKAERERAHWHAEATKNAFEREEARKLLHAVETTPLTEWATELAAARENVAGTAALLRVAEEQRDERNDAAELWKASYERSASDLDAALAANASVGRTIVVRGVELMRARSDLDTARSVLSVAVRVKCELAKKLARMEVALAKIDAIRNSIVALQTMNWSEHAYPLVAALEEAGFKGSGYPGDRENFGTLFERLTKAEAALAQLREEAKGWPTTKTVREEVAAENARCVAKVRQLARESGDAYESTVPHGAADTIEDSTNSGAAIIQELKAALEAASRGPNGERLHQFAIHLDRKMTESPVGETCILCGALNPSSPWCPAEKKPRSDFPQSHAALTRNTMHNPDTNTFDPIPEPDTERVTRENPKWTFREGEEVQVKGLLMRVKWITGKALTLEPIRRVD
jgi:hypothetical protein